MCAESKANENKSVWRQHCPAEPQAKFVEHRWTGSIEDEQEIKSSSDFLPPYQLPLPQVLVCSSGSAGHQPLKQHYGTPKPYSFLPPRDTHQFEIHGEKSAVLNLAPECDVWSVSSYKDEGTETERSGFPNSHSKLILIELAVKKYVGESHRCEDCKGDPESQVGRRNSLAKSTSWHVASYSNGLWWSYS
ncbi:hypothetical protein Y1Q_0002761 [Alligator mississippiensis]|uniref:Uncharacterized protein n=1 Tax=Alligator mississippiensis TaxID=8496 RepID=A0A151NZC4_ALLMI|nr:hypothetical protein Y1Q_0002761 [Alligator mississippiensis]